MLKEIAEELLTHYRQQSFICCEKRIEPTFVDETIFKLGTHGGMYDKDQNGWFPHYDIEFKCFNCRYYEHYTHYIDGTIIAMTIMNVIFDFTDDEFGIIEEGKIIPAGKLPDNIEYGSKEFQIYFQKILEKASAQEEGFVGDIDSQIAK